MSSFKKMKLYRFIVCVVLATISFIATGCQENEIDNREHGYGHVQFKLYKQASYDAGNVATQSATRAITSRLEYLSDACKVKVTLSYNSTTISQTLTLQAADGDLAEFGLRSATLKLLVGDYKILNFRLYDANDEELYIGTVGENNTFSVTEGGLLVHDLTVNVTPRGKVSFSLKKDMSDFNGKPQQKAAPAEAKPAAEGQDPAGEQTPHKRRRPHHRGGRRHHRGNKPEGGSGNSTPTA
jgi:hypothetical protein